MKLKLECLPQLFRADDPIAIATQRELNQQKHQWPKYTIHHSTYRNNKQTKCANVNSEILQKMPVSLDQIKATYQLRECNRSHATN